MPEANESIKPFTLLGGILYLDGSNCCRDCQPTLAGTSDDCAAKPYPLIW